MLKIKKYIPIFLFLVLCLSFSGCGIKGFIRNIQDGIKNFGAATKTGQGHR